MLKSFNISKSYDQKIILKERNDSFIENEITVIFGASGSGKSTYLKILSGLLKQDSGDLFFFEKLIEKNELKNFYTKNCFYISQTPFFFNDIRIKEYLNLFKNNFNSENFSELIEIFELNEFYEFYPFNLSGGQKYRLALVLSLISKKKILFWDEPTANIDFEIKNKIFNYLKKNILGKIIIISSHDNFFLNKKYKNTFI